MLSMMKASTVCMGLEKMDEAKSFLDSRERKPRFFVSTAGQTGASARGYYRRVPAIDTHSHPLGTAARQLFFVSMIFVGCCGRDSNPAVAPVTVASGPCVVHGSVKFSGDIPPIRYVGGDCFPGAEPVPAESTVVNPDETLKNVVVYIKAGPNVRMPDPPEAVLAQKNCRYVPHVRALRTGQVMNVTNHDPTAHNVLVQSDDNPAENIEELQGGSHGFHFDHAGIVRFRCQVHPWMSAYVYVFDNPCFAVTGDDGTFEIGHLPPGSYTLVAWHEKYGEIEKPFTVAGDKPVVVDFEYRP
jgi:plastocyanin